MNNKTQFVRVEKNKNYTMINNVFLRRKDLSWKAKGILTYILSLPNDWNINLNEVMRHSTDGEASFRSGWKELTKAGYVDRQPVRDKQRIKYWETVVYESVDIKDNSLLGDYQDVENQDVDYQDVENRKLLSTYITNDLSIPSTDKDDYLNVLEWSQSDLFWQTNILSPAKLRKQFDTLMVQMQSNRNKHNGYKPAVVPQQTKIHKHVIDDEDREAFERLQREGF